MEFLEEDDLYINILRNRQLNKLWDVNERLYEVDIVKQNDDLKISIDDVLNINGILCHLCNIEVPKLYINAHNESTIHKNLLKLTDEALERTRKHLKQNPTSNVTIKVEDSIYCDLCSKIIKKTDKQTHEQTDIHMKSVNFNRLLSCFLDSFLNINKMTYKLDCNQNIRDENNLTGNTEVEYNILLSQTLTNEPNDSNLKETEPDTENIPKKQKEKAKSNKIQEHHKQYISTIKIKYPTDNYDIEAVGSNQIKIKALNNDVIIVPLNNFHSYNGKYCQICLPENKELDHEMVEEHVRRIMTPVADRNCIREMDDIWSHCIICNALTTSVDAHKITQMHMNNLAKYHLINLSRNQMMLEKDQMQNIQQDGGVTKDNIEFFQRIESKIDSLFPIFKKALENEDIDLSDEEFQIVRSKNAKPSVIEKNNNQTPNTIVEIIKDESLTKEPETNLDLASQTKNIQKSEVKFKDYCHICRIGIPNYNIHKTTDTHIEAVRVNKMTKKIMVRNKIQQNKNPHATTVKCGLCNSNVNFDRDNIEAHINTESHRKNYLKFMENNKIILIDDEECHCEPCDQRQSRNNVFNHCSSPNHFHKLKTHLNDKPIDKAPKKKTEIKVDNPADIMKFMHHFEDKNSFMLCKICQVNVSKIYVAIKKHIDSTEHNKLYNEVIQANKLKRINDAFQCQACSEDIPLGSEISHIFTSTHLDKLIILKTKATQSGQTNEPKTTNLNTSVLIENVPKTQAKRNETEKPKEIIIPLYLRYQFKKINKTEALCVICKKNIAISNLLSHAQSMDHQFQFDLLMISNRMKIKKDSVYTCLICETTITRFNEIDHVYGKLHVKQMGEKGSFDVNCDLEYLNYKYISNFPQGARLIMF